jgi:hypothetical protein
MAGHGIAHDAEAEESDFGHDERLLKGNARWHATAPAGRQEHAARQRAADAFAIMAPQTIQLMFSGKQPHRLTIRNCRDCNIPMSRKELSMTPTRKIVTAGLAALTLGLTIAATATPADAWGRRYGGYGYRRGPGPWVAGAVGGLALGALAAGAYNGYGFGYGGGSCVARQPVHDAWGNFVGYRRVYVPCY